MRTQQSPTIILVLFILLFLALLPLVYQQFSATFTHAPTATPTRKQHTYQYNQLNSCFLRVGNPTQNTQCMIVLDCTVLTVTPYILAPTP